MFFNQKRTLFESVEHAERLLFKIQGVFDDIEGSSNDFLMNTSDIECH